MSIVRKLERPARGPPTTPIVLLCLLAVPFGLRPVAPAFAAIRRTLLLQSETVQAATIVGVVLAEAIALYVGYGALAVAADPAIRALLADDSVWNSSD